MLATCRKLIARHGLEMKLVDAEVMFGAAKWFQLLCGGAHRFRALVVDLAKALKMRIELRQIGVRDEARMFGGLGPVAGIFAALCSRLIRSRSPFAWPKSRICR